MLIGIDGIPLATLKSGIGHYTLELATSLATSFTKHYFELVAPVPVELETSNLPANLQFVEAPVNALRKRWWTIGLPLYVRQKKYSLYHGTNYNIPLWHRCPSVVTVHDLSLLLYSETHRADLVQRARRRLPTMTRLADHIITDSESVKLEIVEHLHAPPEKITAVPLAPRSSFRPMENGEAKKTLKGLRIEEDFILFVGTVEPRKNLISLVRAFDRLLKETDLRPQLVIAGQKGWLSDELYSYIEKSELGNRVLFTGYISDEELRALYSTCLTAVYPSLYEGFGLPPLEAMSCGAPVITSRIPVIRETSEGAAVLVDPNDIDELTDALVQLLSDKARRDELRERGVERARKYSWDRTAKKTFEVYEAVLRKHSGEQLQM